MAYTFINGDDTAGSDAPWFLRTTITCPRCGWQGRLSYEEFAVVIGPHGASGNIWHGWRQLVEGTPTTAATDSTHLWIDPAQVVGPCPYCFLQLSQHGPNYGSAKLAAITVDPSVGLIQSYIAGGATSVRFYKPWSGALVGVFFMADGTAYGIDALFTANAVRRIDTNLLDAATKYLLHTPATTVSAAAATTLDSGLAALLIRLGLTLP